MTIRSNPRPQLQDSYSPVRESDITDFEAEIHAELPADYKSFLLSTNGGYYPESAVFVRPDWDPKREMVGIDGFRGLNTGYDFFDVRSCLRWLTVPKGFLPIADDGVGNTICLGLRGIHQGRVFLFDHEISSMDWGEIASSFAELISNIYSNESDDYWQERMPVFIAAERGEVQLLETMLESDCSIDGRNGVNSTLLMTAARSRQGHIVKMLLERGADHSLTNDDGTTALIMAAQAGSLDSCKALLKAGALINFQNETGDTALRAAINGPHVRIVEYFISNGADLDLPNREGMTPRKIQEFLADATEKNPPAL